MYNWKEQRERKALLALECGEIFKGYSTGAETDCIGEVIFNTAANYQQIITDPSHAGLIITLNSPETGNYGVVKDDMESKKPLLNGLIIHELNPPSNFRSDKSLKDFLITNGIPAIAGVDTRRLTMLIRNKGSQKAFLHCSDKEISPEEAINAAKKWDGINGQDYASRAGTEKQYQWNKNGNYNVVAVDFGIKRSMLRLFEEHDINITVVPPETKADEILETAPDGVFLSSGPGDPSALGYAVSTVKKLIPRLPVIGIALGHQLIGLALGAETGRLKSGHHGGNHPVRNLLTGKTGVYQQCHNYVVLKDSLQDICEITHINLNDNTVEGIRHKTAPVFSVQYYPDKQGFGEMVNEFKSMMRRG